MLVRFPCHIFTSLPVNQQNTVKYLFKTKLLRLVTSISPLNIGVLQLRKASEQFIEYLNYTPALSGTNFKAKTLLQKQISNNDLSLIEVKIWEALMKNKHKKE